MFSITVPENMNGELLIAPCPIFDAVAVSKVTIGFVISMFAVIVLVVDLSALSVATIV